jgi:hypothetical protein
MAKLKASRPATKARSLSELVDDFLRLDARETDTLERAQVCEIQAGKSFPKRSVDMLISTPHCLKGCDLTVEYLHKHWDELDALAVDDATRAANARARVRALDKLRRVGVREAAILEAAGYFPLKAKADEAEAAVNRAIDQILTYPIASWSDVAAMLRFMGRWEPFDDADEGTRDGDMVMRAYRCLKDGVARKAKL